MRQSDILSRKGSGDNTLRNADEKVVSIFDAPQSSSVSNWKAVLLAQLGAFRRQNYHDFDFSGPIEVPILEQTEDFIRSLPHLIVAPVIGINSDGTILLEWFKHESGKPATMYSAILNGSEIIFSLMVRGITKSYGALSYSDESVEMVAGTLNKHFEKIFNAKRPPKAG